MEDIDIYASMYHGGAMMLNAMSVCKNSSTSGGVQKNPNCSVCNLERLMTMTQLSVMLI